ncbi:hypothetical protein GS597_03445 [Synechococcales cyanobacterium C]|uniref:Uncharacterized protein n=2 Tax=Petrachloros TaxID=2918834 RepID=A0A8K1ZWU3_9CYAN|nr:hypothetical protein [Petrachloros mirabilis ULC683]
MKYPSPDSSPCTTTRPQKGVSEALVAAAIAGVIHTARSQGQTLKDLQAEVMEDDHLLDRAMRRWLSEVVSEVWAASPEFRKDTTE